MLVRRLARPLLAAMFIEGGIDALRNPQARAEKSESVAVPLANKLPINLPDDPVQLVRIDAATKIGAGALLATGRVPRLASVVLAGSLMPTTLAGHPYWAEKDPAVRAQQKVHFFKNLGLLGGLLLAAVDTEGKPSIGWRAGHAADATTRKASKAAAKARKKAQKQAKAARKTLS